MLFTKENLFTKLPPIDQDIMDEVMFEITVDDELRGIFLGKDMDGTEPDFESTRDLAATFLHPEEVKWFDLFFNKVKKVGKLKSIAHGYARAVLVGMLYTKKYYERLDKMN